jgi:hypothetical protein
VLVKPLANGGVGAVADFGHGQEDITASALDRHDLVPMAEARKPTANLLDAEDQVGAVAQVVPGAAGDLGRRYP